MDDKPGVVIACLSQKGGVGKSTISRLIARSCAAAGWQVKIADFNVKQKTSVDWAALRMSNGVEPQIPAEAFTQVHMALKQPVDLIVMDGRPDSDPVTLQIAKAANLIIVPTGAGLDDLKPQVLFAHELRRHGIEARRILFVLNKTTDSKISVIDARRYIQEAGYTITKIHLPMKQVYQLAHNYGRTLSETSHTISNQQALELAAEIIGYAAKPYKELQGQIA